ncbi:MAG: DUF167 domain-containing protein [Candidatus Magasanikbacteria bacterium]|nr:DUF167 domain-containing protein [Candidatus Magasanikbacteria bacterium]
MKKICVRITPRSSQDEIVAKLSDGCLKIKLKAAPVEGEANKALIKFLSKTWGIRKTDIKIVKGLTSKHKTIEINTDLAL